MRHYVFAFCCYVLGSEECPDTQETTCHSGHPGCPDPTDAETLYCTLTITIPYPGV